MDLSRLAPELADLADRTMGILRGLAPLGIAVSGGVDSRLLATLALEAGVTWRCLHFRGPHQSPAESDWALGWFRSLSITPLLLDCSPLDLAEGSANQPDRCYHCKRHCMQKGLDSLHPLGVNILADGSNRDDLGEHRPGRRALGELGVRSPLAEAGMGKSHIRATARALGMAWPDQPSRACLLTRFPYGHAPSASELERVGRAEDALAALGLRNFRLRLAGSGRMELHLDRRETGLLADMRSQVEATLAQHFPKGCPLVLQETLSGFFDAREETPDTQRDKALK